MRDLVCHNRNILLMVSSFLMRKCNNIVTDVLLSFLLILSSTQYGKLLVFNKTLCNLN